MKIISFSLWGNDPKYTVGAIRNAELSKEIYPGWICRFYLGEDVSEDIENELLKNNAETFKMDGCSWNGMFWRFFAADSNDVVISRDTDSRINEREKFAVEEWLDSDKDFHIMRDHAWHGTEILGGMWGCRNGILKGIKDMIHQYDKGQFDNKWQVDQNFLREHIYSSVKDKAMVHDEFFEKKSFPDKSPARTSIYFVGQVYDENERPQFQ
jgi:protein O-GlcNAc transferase